MGWFKDFDRMTPFIRTFRPMLARSLESEIEDAYDQMTKNWRDGKDAMGRAWAPNAPSTLRNKPGSTPLIETQQMLESAGYNVDGGELSGAIYIDDDDGKVLAHEHGVPDMGIPPRPILQPTKEYVEDDADKIMTRAFDKAWARAAVQGTTMQVGIGSGMVPGDRP